MDMDKNFIISYFGSQSKTASALGIAPASVFEWPQQLPYSAIGRIVVHQPKAYAAWKKHQKKAA